MERSERLARNQAGDDSRWEELEQCIKSGQVDAQELVQLLNENPEFATWYKERNQCNF